MTREELIAIGSHKVRRDENLMAFYLQEFEKLFGRKPNCAACTFVSDWRRFEQGKKNVSSKNIFKMEKTFELNNNAKNIIHTYRIDKRPIRTYGYKMTEEFAKAYLEHGTTEQIEARKQWFRKLPKEAIEVENPKEVDETIITVNGEEVFLSDATGKQMTAYAKENGIDFGDAKKVDDKREVIRKTL